MSLVNVARLDDLRAGQPKLVEVGGARLVLVCVKDEVYACDDVCAHQGGPLSQGKLSGVRLACPWHGWMYDVRTGECVMPGRGTRVELTVWTEPATRLDAFKESLGGRRWLKRQLKKSLTRLRRIFEDERQKKPLERATIAGYEPAKAARFGSTV